MQLELITGDIAKKALCSFSIDAGSPRNNVRFTLDGTDALIEADLWPEMVEQVKAKELVKRHFPGGLESPLLFIERVVKQITSTPRYQLFLAGIDIAERIELVSAASAENVKRRFLVIREWMPSVTGAGGLFFVPDSVTQGHSDRDFNQLIFNNKLCKAVLGNHDVVRFYVPYATPMGYVARSVSRSAADLWQQILRSYNHARLPV